MLSSDRKAGKQHISLQLNNHQWQVWAGNDGASGIVATLASIIMASKASPLSPTQPSSKLVKHKLMVFTDSELKESSTTTYLLTPELCITGPPSSNDMLTDAMSQVALTIARTELFDGALLIHGALAEVPARSGGGGILLAGPCSVGKTTASNRLPLPWRSASDDASLILLDKKGQYHAHPWPTWSRFRNTTGDYSPNDTWDVQRGLPLRAIFFLTQSAKDHVTPLPSTYAWTCLLEAVRHVSRLMSWGLSNKQAHSLHKRMLNNIESLIQVTPIYKLNISLNGTFWKRIEETFAYQTIVKPISPSPTVAKPKNNSLQDKEIANGAFIISFMGSSMHPTLQHSDLLKIKPYKEHPIKQGDIIYFQPPTGGTKIVHRIAKITQTGIVTRGDNNITNDPYLIKKDYILGKVTIRWRHSKPRNISCGYKGTLIAYYCWFRHRIYHSFALFLRKAYRQFTTSTLLNKPIPRSFHPQIFEFKQRLFPSRLKLMVRGRVIGQYNYKLREWQIKPPWRLFVDETLLPKVK